MRTLVLNAGFEPMILVSWQRAICLVLSDKAEIVSEYEGKIRTVSTFFPTPSVVRLNRYVNIVRQFGIVRCTRRNIMLRDRYQCQYCGVQCGTNTISIDHVIPKSKGGRTVWDNVVAACHTCNRRKGDKTAESKGMKLNKFPRRPSWREIIGEIDKPLEAAWLPYFDYAG